MHYLFHIFVKTIDTPMKISILKIKNLKTTINRFNTSFSQGLSQYLNRTRRKDLTRVYCN
nr:MAG TPA: hypothetical protein [Caudoviricetes sp.]